MTVGGTVPSRQDRPFARLARDRRGTCGRHRLTAGWSERAKSHREAHLHLALLALTLQLRTAALAPPAMVPGMDGADSVRATRRARDAQASFERTRRASLPWESGSGGRCDVRLGRFCWWYDEYAPPLPPETERITDRRDELIALLDSLSRRLPGDGWLAGMRVHYRIDGRRPESADSAARDCRAEHWWCDALVGYAAHVRGDAARADSAFTSSVRAMPDSVRCTWTDIHTLMPGGTRGYYEDLPCEGRPRVERRYWMLARPRLAAPANEWRNEYYARRVQNWLAERSLTPQNLRWGDDAAELLLRYGWPTQWGRVHVSGASFGGEYGVVGHDPSPSFTFGPRAELLDTLVSAGDDGWDLRSRQGESRFAPRGVKRVVAVAMQLARFRRGDSTLIAAAFAATDDSLKRAQRWLAASSDDGITSTSTPDSSARGTAVLLVPTSPRLAGVEISDSVSGTLARSRMLFAPDSTRSRVALSDLLLFRREGDDGDSLAAVLPRAIPGDSASRERPIGLFWETYGLAHAGETVDVAVTVERIDRSWFRSAQQHLGLADEDTPIRVRWTDARPEASGVKGHAISLDLSNQPGGRYRITLTLTPSEEPPAAAWREVELLAP